MLPFLIKKTTYSWGSNLLFLTTIISIVLFIHILVYTTKGNNNFNSIIHLYTSLHNKRKMTHQSFEEEQVFSDDIDDLNYQLKVSFDNENQAMHQNRQCLIMPN